MAAGAVGQLQLCDTCIDVAFGNRLGLVIVTAITGIFRITLGVAQTAFQLALTSVVELEPVNLQQSRRPGLVTVTVLAAQSEETGVQLGLCMALHTFPRCAGEFLVGMALCAIDFCVATIQHEDPGVVKSHHAVYTIVALLAVVSVLHLVLDHEISPLCIHGVAGDTRLHIELVQGSLVTILADHSLFLEIQVVPAQAEAGMRLVFEWPVFQFRWRPAGRGVAFGALR
jgi:hypothetical protein